jgi:GNAT superfamily N-acetyltransferase
LRDVVAVQSAIYPEPFDWLFENYAGLLRDAPQKVAMYCAYAGDRPVATGWIDFPEDSTFAELHGGSVLPSRRGQGIFSALVDRRMRDARARGYEFVAVDAAPMSRPILARQGFTPVCLTYPLRLRS